MDIKRKIIARTKIAYPKNEMLLINKSMEDVKKINENKSPKLLLFGSLTSDNFMNFSLYI
jgi:hypothetical protein